MAPDRGTLQANNLAAILLVTTSRPGPKLVFHYPPTPSTTPSPSKGDDDLDSDSDTALNNVSVKATNENDTQPPNSSTQPGTIFNFTEESLEKLLSPGCWCDRKKFETCLDGLTFLGYPIFADHDGSFARRHTHKPSTGSTNKQDTGPLTQTPELGEDAVGRLSIAEPKTPGRTTHDFTHVPESLETPDGLSLATSMQSASSTSAAVAEKLTMFHVVFVLKPSVHLTAAKESVGGLGVDDLYENVVKKLSRALQYCQKQTSYIGLESRKLLSLKMKAKQDGTDAKALSDQMIESSELAWALKEVYTKISHGEIAGIRLHGTEISLQIPQPHETDELGLHSALLLLDEKDSLLRQLSHPDASPLAYIIRENTSTKSLQKQALKLGIPVTDLLFLAQHLVKWRKARAIAPLHIRNTYIVAPEAPLEQLESCTRDYAKRFSGLPSLPQVLGVLSAKPVKWGQLIPSKDHRAPYMEILAYLVRHRFVEQLKTAGWLQASTANVSAALKVDDALNENRRPMSVASLLSPQLKAVDGDEVSVSSERTTIPVSVFDAAKAKQKSANTPAAPTSAPAPTIPSNVDIIRQPLHLNTEDSQRLSHIRTSLHRHDPDLAERLPSLLKYFDGEQAFEGIAAREGLKRSKVEAWIEILQREGFIWTWKGV